jgi:hypothetical protein
MNIEKYKNWLILASIIIIILNLRIYSYASMNQYPPEDQVWTSIILSFLPAAVLIIALQIFRGRETRLFRVAIGVISLSYAWELIADPWSVSLRMSLGQSLMPMIIYTAIGTVFLLIAVIAFRRVEG